MGHFLVFYVIISLQIASHQPSSNWIRLLILMLLHAFAVPAIYCCSRYLETFLLLIFATFQFVFHKHIQSKFLVWRFYFYAHCTIRCFNSPISWNDTHNPSHLIECEIIWPSNYRALKTTRAFDVWLIAIKCGIICKTSRQYSPLRATRCICPTDHHSTVARILFAFFVPSTL